MYIYVEEVVGKPAIGSLWSTVRVSHYLLDINMNFRVHNFIALDGQTERVLDLICKIWKEENKKIYWVNCSGYTQSKKENRGERRE